AVVQVGVPKDPAERLKLATEASVAAARKLTGKVTKALLSPILAGIKVRYGLQELQPYEEGGTWWVYAVINPRARVNTGVSAGTPAPAGGAAAGTGAAPPREGRGARGIGRIGLHGSKPSSLRTGPKIWHLESEHIIPFATGKRLWEVISLVVPGRGGHED